MARPQMPGHVLMTGVHRLRGERVYEVPSLTTPPGRASASVDPRTRSSAVALFVDRARAVKPGFDVTDGNAADLADVCRRLEGPPLEDLGVLATRFTLKAIVAAGEAAGAELTVAEAVLLALPDSEHAVVEEHLRHW